MKKNTILHTPLWQTTHAWLKACGNKLSSDYCKEEIATHPDYPSLLSVIDFLESGGMVYKAVQADPSYINEFNYPLLAHIKKPGDEYLHIIKDTAEWDKQKEITEHWSGIAVYPEKNAEWQSEQHTIYQRNEIKNKIIAIAFALTGFVLFIISTYQHFNFLIAAFGFLSLTGLIISFFALGTELGFHSQIVKQVCGAVSEGGCEKVLKSNYAKGFAGITPADASVLYFGAQFIFYLIGCWYPSLLQSIFLFAIGGIAVAAWSIYTQAVKLKQWCALCLAIVAVLIVQAFIAFAQPLTSFYSSGFIMFSVLLLALSLPLISVKQLIKINSSNKLKLAELKKWKLDAGLFINQWQEEQSVDATIWQNDLLLGNPDAPLQITVACNPYCGPCAKAHKQLDELLYRFYDKLKVQVRLLFSIENENNKLTVAAKAILQKVANTQKNSELQQMLSDWFEWMDEDKWIQKWQPDSAIDISKRIMQHNQWIKESKIALTPTFFINGRKLPGRYSLNDVEVLIPQLVEMMRKTTIT